ncbi:hypothetical protein ACLOJK_027895 [Asimina triloba]
MLKFLSKVRIEFNALDPRTATCMEFLAQCNARKAKESNPACQLLVKRRTDDHPPQIAVTYVNGVEEVIDATVTSAQSIRQSILEKGQLLETEQMFKDAGEPWPVIIPEEELHQKFPGTKVDLLLCFLASCLVASGLSRQPFKLVLAYELNSSPIWPIVKVSSHVPSLKLGVIAILSIIICGSPHAK